MNLEEKAKTYLEIERWTVEQTLECRPYDEELYKERMKVKWVLLSDAQQEIDAFVIRLDSVQFCLDKATESLKREREEWKQKLGTIFTELDSEDKWHINPIMNRIRKILEETTRNESGC